MEQDERTQFINFYFQLEYFSFYLYIYRIHNQIWVFHFILFRRIFFILPPQGHAISHPLEYEYKP